MMKRLQRIRSAPVALVMVAACAEPTPQPVPVARPQPTAPATAVPPERAPDALPAPRPADPTTVERPPECIGRDFDLDGMFAHVKESPCAFQGDAAALAKLAGPDAIEIAVAAEPATVAPSAKAKLLSTFKNISGGSRTIMFLRACDDPLLRAEAHGSNGERADLVPSEVGCGVSRGCEVARIAITLEAGGVARATGEYWARSVKVDRGCREYPVGALPKGSYTLRVSTPLLSVDPRFPEATSPRVASVALTVGR